MYNNTEEKYNELEKELARTKRRLTTLEDFLWALSGLLNNKIAIDSYDDMDYLDALGDLDSSIMHREETDKE